MTTKDQAIAPPYGSKREAAKAVYTPPFKFQRGYIFDSQQSMVADDDRIARQQWRAWIETFQWRGLAQEPKP